MRLVGPELPRSYGLCAMTPEFREFREGLIDECFDSDGPIELADDGEDESGDEQVLRFTVAGATFRQPLLRRLHAAAPNGLSPINLVRDVGNAHSRSAIAVMYDRDLVGFVPDHLAAVFAPHLDSGQVELDCEWCGWWVRKDADTKDGQPLVGLTAEVSVQPWRDELTDDATEDGATPGE